MAAWFLFLHFTKYLACIYSMTHFKKQNNDTILKIMVAVISLI